MIDCCALVKRLTGILGNKITNGDIYPVYAGAKTRLDAIQEAFFRIEIRQLVWQPASRHSASVDVIHSWDGLCLALGGRIQFPVSGTYTKMSIFILQTKTIRDDQTIL